MTSQINPNNINGAYPVAGQDNNSQGFRDNFTNTGTNFQFAANEITDLQNKVILNQPLIGGAILANQNNMLGSPLINGLISDFAAAAISLGVTGGDVTINYQSGHYQTFTTNSAVILGFNNFPPAGQMGIVTVQITVSQTVHTVTMPTTVSVNLEGIQGYNPANRAITFAAPGVYSFTFITNDGGSTITINEYNNALRGFAGSGEIITANGAANLSVCSTRFETATQPIVVSAGEGAAGQIKVFTLANNAGGGARLTLTNAGWANGVANITFSNRGDSCILRNAGGQWWAIGTYGLPVTSAGSANVANVALSVAGANVTGPVANATNAVNSINSVNATNAVNAVTAGTANAVAGANVIGTVTTATTAATVTTSAQPNITSVGNLTSVTVTGNATAVNFIGSLVGNAATAGTVTTNAQPNITSVGTLTSLSVTGNIDAGNVIATNLTGPLLLSSQGTPQTIPVSASPANITLICDTVGVDTAGTYDAATGIYTPNKAGYYQINGSVLFDITGSNPGTSAALSLIKTLGGTPTVVALGQQAVPDNGTFSSALSTIVYMNGSTDSLRLLVGYTNPTTAFATNAALPTFFQACWLRS